MRYADSKFVSNPGSPIHVVFSPRVGKDGVVELVESGFEDIRAYINSFRDSTDLRIILARVQSGDISALMSRPGSYGDFTQMPKTYAEVLQLQIDSRRIYDSLPVDIKARFNNDPNQFLASAGTDQWFDTLKNVLPAEVMQMVKPPVAEMPVVEKDVKE